MLLPCKTHCLMAEWCLPIVSHNMVLTYVAPWGWCSCVHLLAQSGCGPWKITPTFPALLHSPLPFPKGVSSPFSIPCWGFLGHSHFAGRVQKFKDPLNSAIHITYCVLSLQPKCHIAGTTGCLARACRTRRKSNGTFQYLHWGMHVLSGQQKQCIR